jgi:hypothetical protein
MPVYFRTLAQLLAPLERQGSPVRGAFAVERAEDEAGTVDSLYERVRARLLAEPERYLWRYILVAALLTRR